MEISVQRLTFLTQRSTRKLAVGKPKSEVDGTLWLMTLHRLNATYRDISMKLSFLPAWWTVPGGAVQAPAGCEGVVGVKTSIVLPM